MLFLYFRPLIIACIAVLLLFLKPAESCASHSMGADLTYQCLGGNTYKLRLSFYRDCNGISAPFFVNINISSATCGFNYSELAFRIPGTGQDITPICLSALSTCQGGSLTGVQEWIYEAVITLPAECNDWQFSYNLCCRNGAISTINNPLVEDIYVFSMLNNTGGICNNSPTFENRPVPFICLGQQFCFNHGSTDVDGDSLVYAPITPLTSAGTTVLYNSPYSATQPLNSLPAATFNAVTGDFCLTPQSLEVTVMAVLVSEYRNGVMIGQVERDIQITVLNCNNTLPLLSGINGTSSFSTTACAGAPFCFDIFSTDPDPAQTVTLSWDGTIPGATFTSGSALRPTGTFCWTPQAADVSTIPHCFTVMVKDDACPYEGSQVFSYCITVQNILVDAGVDQSIGCNDLALLNPTVSGTSNTYTYLWNTGATTPGIAAGTGSYTVTVSSGLCNKSDSVLVTSPVATTADFFSVNTCGNGPVTFTDQSSASVPLTSWQWSFGDGATSSLPSPLHQYASPGNYQVRLIIQAGNCIDTVIKPINIAAEPVAAFSILAACPGSPVPVSNTSLGSTLNYNWDFGNGSSSTLSVPDLIYASGGNYLVSLQVTDSLGCSDTSSTSLTIPPMPVAQISIPALGLCAGPPILFSGSVSTPVTTWNWDFGNGLFSSLQNPLMLLPEGQQTISLVVNTSAGCSDTVLRNLFIPPLFIADPILPLEVCSGVTVNMSAPPGVSYLWSNGSTASTLTLTATSSSNLIVTVTNSSGCTDTSLARLNVLPLPNLLAGADQRICRGDSLALLATGGSSYVWSGGQTTAAVFVRPSANASYSVIATAVNGCTRSDTVNVWVNAIPAVAFSATTSCQSEPVIFTNGSIGTTPMNYLWRFGDGTSLQNVVSPNHTYPSPGAYDVVLVVTDSNGCIDSVMKPLIISAAPQAAFTILPACPGAPVSISNTSSGSVLSYSWDFGNGDTSSLPVPDLIYASGGTYAVSLKVSDTLGCIDTDSVPLTIPDLPVAQITIPNAGLCGGTPLIFSGSASIPVATWSWDFGNSLFSSLQNPQILFPEGPQTVSLIVNTSAGCSDTVLRNLIIPPPFIADAILPLEVCSGVTVNMSAPPGVSYLWSNGSTASTLTLTATSSSNFIVTVTNTIGCSDTSLAILTVLALPNVSAGSDQHICNGDSVKLLATGGNTYLWSGGQTAGEIIVKPLATSSYSIIATAFNGCTRGDTVRVIVNPLPSVSFSASSSCQSKPVSFANTSSGALPMNYLWTFGDGSVLQNVFSPQHNYLLAGMYDVVLVVTDSNGCSDSSGSSVNVFPDPIVQLHVSTRPGCYDNVATYSFTANSIFASWQWSFLNGNTSTLAAPQITYSQQGNFPVSFSGVTAQGCTATALSNTFIEIYTLPVADFYISGELKKYMPVFFINSSFNANSYLWSFGDGGSSLLEEPQHIYQDSGNYTIELIAENDFGCRDTAYKLITMPPGWISWIPNAFSPNEDGVNDVFTVSGYGIREFSLAIYNRWGVKIYLGINEGWNGSISNGEVQAKQDVYVYELIIIDILGESHEKSGRVSLIR